MSKTNAAQLALLDLPLPEAQGERRMARRAGTPSAGPRKVDRTRRRLSAEQTALHCNALLAELERVTLRDQSAVERLAELYAAAERLHGHR
jgi:hypothetical protein